MVSGTPCPGEFSPPPLPPPPPGIRPFGWDLDLKAEISVSRLGSGPPEQDFGPKARIWASRRRRKFPICVKA